MLFLFMGLTPFSTLFQVDDGAMRDNLILQKGCCSTETNSNPNSLKEERLDLSTLHKDSSPYEVVEKGVFFGKMNVSFDLALWKFAKNVKNIKSTEREQLKISIAQWNAWSIHTSTKIQFIQSLQSDIVAIQEIWKRSENLEKIGEIIEEHIEK